MCLQVTPAADRGEKLIEIGGPQPGVDVALGRLVEPCSLGHTMISSAEHEVMGAGSQVQCGTHHLGPAAERPQAKLRLSE
jgi:hypothetical protein